MTVASPAYLAKHGEPVDLATLAESAMHRAVNYVSSATGKPVPLEFVVEGRVRELYLGAVVSVSGADLYTGAAVTGLGIVQVPRYRIASELAAGQLQIILPDLPPPPMPVSVLYPRAASCRRGCGCSRNGCTRFSRRLGRGGHSALVDVDGAGLL